MIFRKEMGITRYLALHFRQSQQGNWTISIHLVTWYIPSYNTYKLEWESRRVDGEFNGFSELEL